MPPLVQGEAAQFVPVRFFLNNARPDLQALAPFSCPNRLIRADLNQVPVAHDRVYSEQRHDLLDAHWLFQLNNPALRFATSNPRSSAAWQLIPPPPSRGLCHSPCCLCTASDKVGDKDSNLKL